MEKNSITVDLLTKAIQKGMGDRHLQWEDARRIAEHVMNFFGYSNRIIDNVLEPEDRDLFYMMEDSGILTTDREETTLYDGREWRIHYWTFHPERIMSILEEKEKVEDTPENVYEEIFRNETFFNEMFRSRREG